MLDARNVYEIEFDIPARRREAFEDWVSTDVLEWISHETVAYFEVFRNDTSISPELKFVFGFETLGEWATFVDSDEHEEAVENLCTLANDQEGRLWRRGSIRLDDTHALVSDGGQSRGAQKQYRSDPLISH